MTGDDGKIVVTVYLNGVPDISRTVQGDTFDNWNNTVVPIGPRTAGTYLVSYTCYTCTRLKTILLLLRRPRLDSNEGSPGYFVFHGSCKFLMSC
jgi:hypothetical protein